MPAAPSIASQICSVAELGDEARALLKDDPAPQAYLNLLLPLTSHGFLTIGPGVTWSDQHYMRAFYSVSAEQSELSGLPQFEARRGISDIYGELVAGYEISSRWAVGLDAVYARLQGDAADSPFTESRAQTSWFASILYKFK